MNNPVDTVLTDICKNSSKKSKNVVKENVIKSNISTFDIDDCAMDIDLLNDATDMIVQKDQPKEINKQKLNELVDIRVVDQNIKSEVNTLQTDKKSSEDIIIEETEDIKLVYNEESNSNTNKTKIKNTPSKPDIAPIISHKTPRRVKLITLSSPKELKKQ